MRVGLDDGEEVLEGAPDSVRDAAYAAFERREPGVAVAHLIYDSVLDVSSAEVESRHLRFVRGDHSVDLAVRADADRLAIEIDASPAGCLDIEVRHDRPTLGITSGADAHATSGDVQPGLVSLLVRWPGGDRLRTAWVRL